MATIRPYILSVCLAAAVFAGSSACKERVKTVALHGETLIARSGDTLFANKTEKQQEVRLPDGSRVVMMARTVMRISKAFNQVGRELELDGEALFDIDADAGKPFIVHTRNLQIEVLGTRFRVDAHRDNAGEEVDLLEGRLRVIKSYHSDTDNEPEFLNAGEMVMINRDIDLIEKEKMDSTEWNRVKAMP
jgi:ferric-dicitrate binding protein FerR (iron transport regulator)